MPAMRALPWASSVSIGICQPSQERALTPMFCSAIASQAAGHLLAGRHHHVVFAGVVQRRQLAAPGDQLVGGAGHGGDHDRDLVCRRRPRASRARATARMRSMSATEVPPNFMTMRVLVLAGAFMCGESPLNFDARISRRPAGNHCLAGGGYPYSMETQRGKGWTPLSSGGFPPDSAHFSRWLRKSHPDALQLGPPAAPSTAPKSPNSTPWRRPGGTRTATSSRCTG